MDITEFGLTRNEKMLSELVTKTWQMVSAKEKLEARKVSRFDTVWSHLTSDCVEGCSAHWFQCSKEVLLLIGMDTHKFLISIKGLLIH